MKNLHQTSEIVVRIMEPFIKKLYEIIVNGSYFRIISFDHEGKRIEIKNVKKFEKIVLKKHFPNLDFLTFHKVLNNYCFRKSKNEDTYLFINRFFTVEGDELSKVKSKRYKRKRVFKELDDESQIIDSEEDLRKSVETISSESTNNSNLSEPSEKSEQEFYLIESNESFDSTQSYPWEDQLMIINHHLLTDNDLDLDLPFDCI